MPFRSKVFLDISFRSLEIFYIFYGKICWKTKVGMGHLRSNFHLPGTQLVAMATLLLRGVHCLFGENYKNGQFQCDIVHLKQR